MCDTVRELLCVGIGKLRFHCNKWHIAHNISNKDNTIYQ